MPTAVADAVIGAEDLRHQVAEAVDDRRVLLEIGGGVDHAQGFHQPRDAVERAEVSVKRRENGEPRLPGGVVRRPADRFPSRPCR